MMTTDEMKKLVELLRQGLGGPKESVDLQEGFVGLQNLAVYVALTWSCYDDGGPESGPHLAVSVTRWLEIDWSGTVSLFDSTLSCKCMGENEDCQCTGACGCHCGGPCGDPYMQLKPFAQFIPAVGPQPIGPPDMGPEGISEWIVAFIKGMGIERGEQ